MNKTELKAAIKALTLPADTKFVGYIITIDKTDEYLHKHSSKDDEQAWIWTQDPELAKTFTSKKEAEVICRGHSSAQLAVLLDAGAYYSVAFM